MDAFVAFLAETGPLGAVAVALGLFAFGWAARRPTCEPLTALAPLLALPLLSGLGFRYSFLHLDPTGLGADAAARSLAEAISASLNLVVLVLLAGLPALLLTFARVRVPPGPSRGWVATAGMVAVVVAMAVLPVRTLELAQQTGPLALRGVFVLPIGLRLAWLPRRSGQDEQAIAAGAWLLGIAALEAVVPVVAQIEGTHCGTAVIADSRLVRLQHKLDLTTTLFHIGLGEIALAALPVLWVAWGRHRRAAAVWIATAFASFVATDPRIWLELLLRS